MKVRRPKTPTDPQRDAVIEEAFAHLEHDGLLDSAMVLEREVRQRDGRQREDVPPEVDGDERFISTELAHELTQQALAGFAFAVREQRKAREQAPRNRGGDKRKEQLDQQARRLRDRFRAHRARATSDEGAAWLYLEAQKRWKKVPEAARDDEVKALLKRVYRARRRLDKKRGTRG